MDLFKIFGTIAVDNAGANGAIDTTTTKAGNMATTIGRKFQSAGSTITGIGKKLAPVSATITAVGTALVGVATKTAQTTDAIDKNSQKLGISRTKYQEWDYILSQNGASIDSLKTGMKTMTNTLDKVKQGGTTVGTAFERLGITYDDLKNKSPEETFETTITALQNCKDETERTKLATQLFGKAGVELAPMLNSGAESTEALKKKAHELGLILDDETIDAGVNMTDAMDTMKRSMTSVGGTIASAVMPLITKFCNYVTSHTPQIREAINKVVQKFDALSPTIKKVIAVVTAVLAVASPVLIVVGKFVSGIGSIITSVGGAITKISSLVSSLGGLSGVIGAIASPVGLIVVAIAALIAIFVILYNKNEDFKKTVQTAWATIKETISGVIDAIKEFIAAFVEVVKAIWDKWGQDIVGIVTTVFNTLMGIINGVLTVIKGIIKTVTALIKGDWKGVWEGIKTIFSGVWDTIKSLINGYMKYIKQVIPLALSVIKTVWEKIWNGIKSFFSTIWNGIKSVVTTSINAIKDKVSEVFNSVKNTISSIFNSIKSKATSVWNGIKTAITTPIETARDTIKGIVNTIKGFFSNMNISFPHIKLPHFKIKPEGWEIGDLLEGEIPSLGIDWYAKGGVMTKPTVFGVNGNNLMVGGEAGDEAIAPISTLQKYIKDAVNEAICNNEDVVKAINEQTQSLYGIFVNALSDGVRFKVDDRELGRVVKKYVG